MLDCLSTVIFLIVGELPAKLPSRREKKRGEMIS